MKICSNCGKEMPDEAVFCPECGGTPESSQANEQRLSAKKILTKVSGSGIILTIAILLTVGIILSIASSVFMPAMLGNVVKEISTAAGDLAGQAGYDMSQLPINDISLQVNMVMNEQAVNGTVISIAIQIVPIIMMIAFWLIYATAKSGKVSTVGFGILQVLQVLCMILLILVTIAVIGGGIYGIGQLNQYSFPGLGILNKLGYTALVFVGAMLVIQIVYRALLIKTLRSFKVVIKERYYNEKISAVAAVMLILGASANLGGIVLLVASTISVGPMALILAVDAVCSSFVPVLCGVAILKAKYLLDIE